MLLDMLACNDNSANPIDDGYWLAGLVAALGQCKLATVADLARVSQAAGWYALKWGTGGIHWGSE
jgi:hypothetical protein